MRSLTAIAFFGGLALAATGLEQRLRATPAGSEQRVAFGARIEARQPLTFKVEKLEGNKKAREVVTCVGADGQPKRLVCKGESIRMKARSHKETYVSCEDMSGTQRTLICQGSPQAVGYPRKVGWDSEKPCKDYHNCPQYDSGSSQNQDWGNEYENPASPKRSNAANAKSTAGVLVAMAYVVLA